MPAELRGRAHVAGNGELLWPRDAALDAARWAAGIGLAIRGGEVYSPRGPFSAVMVDEWQTEPVWSSGEEWSGYVRRGLEQAVAAIEGRAEPVDDHDAAGRILYFLAYHSQREGS